MTAAFSDFLKVRHGGTNLLFAYQSGAAVERPFHSLSYPDIDYTVMRPAALPAFSTLDPGVKNPNNTYFNGVPRVAGNVPPIPARRLFQIADGYGSPYSATALSPIASNASESGDPYVNTPTADAFLSNPYVDLTMPTPITNILGAPANAPFLGSNNISLVGPPPVTLTDNRQHPYFRTEWLQKVINQTTVRTHQFAVWITVGFFEVTTPGNPQTATPDKIGRELGLASGENIRYRAFFIVDRTRATGLFCPWPACGSNDFRDCVLYRRVIQ
jgi:hypothetical protein